MPTLRAVEPRLASIVPTLRLADVTAAIMVPALPVRSPVSIVILRWELTLIARRQILRILPVLRVRAARVVLVGTVFDAIAAAIRLIHPHAPTRLRACLGPETQAKQ